MHETIILIYEYYSPYKTGAGLQSMQRSLVYIQSCRKHLTTAVLNALTILLFVDKIHITELFLL